MHDFKFKIDFPKVKKHLPRPCRSATIKSPERSFNRDAALAHIECNCLNITLAEHDDGWWDIAIAPNDIGADVVAQAVAYFERKGLLTVHPHCESWVKILDRRVKPKLHG